MRILALSGSLQASSSNLDLLHLASEIAPPGLEIIIFDGLRALPHFNPDLELCELSPAVQAWRRSLAESAALLIASPEYGHSLPGSLKNGIDWVIGSGELERKVIGVTASVNHIERGHRGLKALCDTLRAVNATIIGGDPCVRGPQFENELKGLIHALIEAIGKG